NQIDRHKHDDRKKPTIFEKLSWKDARGFRRRQFRKTYNACSRLLQRVNRKLFPKRKRIVLYSTRHQAIANQKAAHNDPAATAVFAGHGVVDTATEHYGKRRVGRVNPNLPTATMDSLMGVRRKHFKKDPIQE
ncbi:site-specific integrase, partial [Desulfonatronum thiodismutans]|uniref:hypothetical protein n=1 Tax=Desulfonatronum thiodismutans TaxID=159290 RepID=UPI0005592BD8